MRAGALNPTGMLPDRKPKRAGPPGGGSSRCYKQGEQTMTHCETTNEDRAERFAALLPLYDDDDHTNAIDILADAMHWCRLNDVDFAEALRVATMHYEAELAGD